MSNALTLFDKPKLEIPSHITDLADDLGTNIRDRVTIPSLSYTGKVWAITQDGETTKLYKKDDEGDDVPLAVMRVIVLDYNPRRGRSYYPGNYDPDSPSQPTCWSEDGITPHASVSAEDKQHGTCEGCPMAVKGSRVTENGKQVQACSQHRMLAVVPASRPDMTPLRLKLAVTSDYDKQSPELEAQGWYAFSNYTDMLRSKGVQHTAALVTKMRFDPNVAYPKVMFSPHDWVSESVAAVVREQVQNPETKNRLNATFTPAGSDGVPATPDTSGDDAAAKAAAEAQAKKVAEEKAAVEAAEKKKAAAAKKAAEKKAAEEKAAAEKAEAEKAEGSKTTVMIMDDDDDEDIPVVKAKAKESDKPAETVSTGIPDDVASLLSEWDD